MADQRELTLDYDRAALRRCALKKGLPADAHSVDIPDENDALITLSVEEYDPDWHGEPWRIYQGRSPYASDAARPRYQPAPERHRTRWVARRTALPRARARGAGRPRSSARNRRSAGTRDDGSGSSEGDGEPPPPPAL